MKTLLPLILLCMIGCSSVKQKKYASISLNLSYVDSIFLKQEGGGFEFLSNPDSVPYGKYTLLAKGTFGGSCSKEIKVNRPRKEVEFSWDAIYHLQDSNYILSEELKYLKEGEEALMHVEIQSGCMSYSSQLWFFTKKKDALQLKFNAFFDNGTPKGEDYHFSLHITDIEKVISLLVAFEKTVKMKNTKCTAGYIGGDRMNTRILLNGKSSQFYFCRDSYEAYQSLKSDLKALGN